MTNKRFFEELVEKSDKYFGNTTPSTDFPRYLLVNDEIQIVPYTYAVTRVDGNKIIVCGTFRCLNNANKYLKFKEVHDTKSRFVLATVGEWCQV